MSQNATLAGPARYVNQVIGPNETLPVLAAGTQFYFTAASGPLFVKPTGGSWTLYYSAMGDTVSAGFSLLNLYNPTAFAVTFSMIVSFSDVIDKRQLPTTAPANVVLPATWFPVVGGDFYANFPDLSGQQFKDSSGTSWLAVQRVSLNFQMLQTGYSFYIQTNLYIVGQVTIIALANFGSNPIVINSAGDFSAVTTTDTVPNSSLLGAFEIYQAIAPNSAAYQPPN